MRVQMWVEWAGSLMLEKRGDDIAGRAILMSEANPNARRCEKLKLCYRDANCHSVRFDDASIVTNERGDRNGLRR